MIETDVTKTNMHKIMNYDKVCAELATLRAEVERLRGYLEIIADAFGCECGDQAREALKGPNQ